MPLIEERAMINEDAASSPDDVLADIFSQTRQQGETLAREQSPASAPLAAVGDYDLMEKLGEGGMGVVYKARQRGAGRIVALKVIRPDRLHALSPESRQSAVERFRTEARAAAQLEHDNIVTVYDVGESQGRHYFSMRYVEGRSLAELLRDGPIANRQAAAYLEPLARAAHEAHLRGILHRDLKPQNVLVDAKTNRPMLADFGLAKLIEGETALTRDGEAIGTPPYMSPEQCRDSARVTASADIYALGATLYHLLTGRPPFQSATALDTLRQVLMEDPVAPRKLNTAIDRDLETICLKCLEKEPERRYASAQLLADDLRLYLGGEPILARPIGPVGHVWRWCRRNPQSASLAGAAALSVVLALAAVTTGYVKTSLAHGESEESYRQARSAVDDLFTRVSEETLLNQPGMQPLRRDLLERALVYYQRFLRQRGDDHSVRDELAATHFRMGLIVEEIESPAKATASYHRAIAAQRRLVAETPHSLERLEALAGALNAQGRALYKLHKIEPALHAWSEAAQVRSRLVDLAPHNRDFRRLLANAHMNLGLAEHQLASDTNDDAGISRAREQFAKAEALRRQLLRDSSDDATVLRDLGRGYYNLANLADAANDLDEAKRCFEAAANALEQALQRVPSGIDDQHDLATCYRRLADLEIDSAAALAMYDKARTVAERLAQQNPAVAKYHRELAEVYRNLGLAVYSSGKSTEAFALFDQASATLEELIQKDPRTPDYQRDSAALLRAMADVFFDQGQTERARESLSRARERLAGLASSRLDQADAQALREVDELLAKTAPGEP
jgi:serine/threonine-protein kinase